MSADVEPEEAEALRGLAEEESREERSVEVRQRDFRQPCRFSGSRLAGLRQRLDISLHKLEGALRALFKASVRCEVEEVREESAAGLFDELERPFALANFTMDGQPAWVQWEIRAAVAAIESLLGSGGDARARELSAIERRLLHEVFVQVVDVVTGALESSASELAVVSATEDVADWEDGGETAEPHRLCVAVRVEGLGEDSRFHLWLPGFRELAGGEEAEVDRAELPEHLHGISVELGAHLGASDVPLSELLSLDIGDVVPLGTTLSDPLVLRVEGRPCGTAEMGSLRGNRAIRILEVNPDLEDLI